MRGLIDSIASSIWGKAMISPIGSMRNSRSLGQSPVWVQSGIGQKSVKIRSNLGQVSVRNLPVDLVNTRSARSKGGSGVGPKREVL